MEISFKLAALQKSCTVCMYVCTYMLCVCVCVRERECVCECGVCLCMWCACMYSIVYRQLLQFLCNLCIMYEYCMYNVCIHL